MVKLRVSSLGVADWFSLVRLMLIPVLLFLVWERNKSLIGWVMLFGFFTDALDGFLARRLKTTSEKGAKLDTVADLSFLICCLFAFFWIYMAFVLNRLWLPAMAIGLFILQYLFSLLRYGRASSFHTYLAKLTAVAMALMLVTSFLIRPVPWLFTLAFSLAIAEALEEIMLVWMLPDWKTDVKGIFWLREHKQ